MGFFRINKEVQARTRTMGKPQARKLFIMEGKRKLGRTISNKCLLLCFMIKAGRGSSPFRPPYFTLSEVYIYKWANKYKKLV